MFTMRVEGLDRLAQNLSQLSMRKSNKVLRNALRVGGEPIRRRAADLAPREPGAPDIAANIVIADGRHASIAIGPSKEARADQPDRSYSEQGVFIEFGTDDTALQPFLGPAFDQVAQSTIAPIGNAIWRELIAQGLVTSRGSGGWGGLL